MGGEPQSAESAAPGAERIAFSPDSVPSVVADGLPAPQKAGRKLFRPSVILRVSAAVLFIAVVAWYIDDRVIGTVSIEGVVSSPIVVLRSPIDGQVTRSIVQNGASTANGAPLFVIEDSRVDERTRNAIYSRLQSARIEVEGTARRIADVVAARALLDERMAIYRSSAVRRVQAMLDQSNAKLNVALAEMERSRKELARAGPLVAHGIESKAHLDSVVAAYEAAKFSAEGERAAIRRFTIELEAAQSGVALGEGYGDAPYSQQRLDELALKLSDLRAQSMAARRNVEEIEQALRAEDDRLARLKSFTVNSPLNGQIWNLRVAGGSEVAKDQALADLVDCERSFVEATVPEHSYDAIAADQPVRIKLNGNSREIHGVVRSRRGAASVVDPNVRAAVLSGSKKEMTVLVEADREEMQDATRGVCQVGRSATVYFDPAKAGFSDVLAWVGKLVGIGAGS